MRALSGAAAECAREGTSFADLSVERLSRRSGISRASFYLYFEDKSELVRGWHHALDLRLEGILAEWWEASPPANELISRVMSDLAATYADEQLVVNAIQDMTPNDPLLRGALDDTFQRQTAALRKHLVRGQRAGWVDANLVAATTAPWLIAMLDRVMQQVVAREEVDSALVETGADIIRNALYSS